MQSVHDRVKWCSRRLIVAALVSLTATWMIAPANGQVISQAVGGVSIDADGLLRNAQVDDLGALAKMREQSLEAIPGELNGRVELRKVSLRRIEAAIDECLKNNKPLPDAVKYLAGLQGVRYIFVYPEEKDIVLAGPAEGWKVDARGNVVGVTTGRPVLLLDDLLVALRSAQTAAQGGITCSIDPTPEGIARIGTVALDGDRDTVLRNLETALGMQQISLRGVPETSHFARVLVAADYRMKRIGMALEASPVRGLPSYLQLISRSNSVRQPRFWLEPKFESVLRDKDGLAWELCGSSVKAMTEEDFFAATGAVKHSGKAVPTAQKWAELMTEKYAELAVADPIFGELQNCMELAVVGAILAKERLAEKAGFNLPLLLESADLRPEVFNAPKQIESKASMMRKVVMTGGVAIHSWALAERAKLSDAVDAVRTKAVSAQATNWWWN